MCVVLSLFLYVCLEVVVVFYLNGCDLWDVLCDIVWCVFVLLFVCACVCFV